MSIIEILDSESIKSNLDDWQSECEKFKAWYFKMGARVTDQAMVAAYQKIEPRKQVIKSKL